MLIDVVNIKQISQTEKFIFTFFENILLITGIELGDHLVVEAFGYPFPLAVSTFVDEESVTLS